MFSCGLEEKVNFWGCSLETAVACGGCGGSGGWDGFDGSSGCGACGACECLAKVLYRCNFKDASEDSLFLGVFRME